MFYTGVSLSDQSLSNVFDWNKNICSEYMFEVCYDISVLHSTNYLRDLNPINYLTEFSEEEKPKLPYTWGRWENLCIYISTHLFFNNETLPPIS